MKYLNSFDFRDAKALAEKVAKQKEAKASEGKK